MITNAPELLEALKILRSEFNYLHTKDCPASVGMGTSDYDPKKCVPGLCGMVKARAAIEKAEGK